MGEKEEQVSQLAALLSEAAKEALEEITDPTDDGRNLYLVNTPIFRQNFKKRWLTFYPNSSADGLFSGSLVFLFYKNFSVTNVQMAELGSLLRLHTIESGTNTKFHDIDITSTDEYNFALENLWISYAGEIPATIRQEAAQAIETIATHIATDALSLLTRTIIADFYYTSCIVHIPRSLRVDVGSLTYESGYIHSSGAALYIRNIEKAAQDELLSSFSLAKTQENGLPIFVTPYADEYFSPHERSRSATSIRNGLDGVRLQLRKHFVQGRPITKFLEELASDSYPDFFIPDGISDYKTEREKAAVRDDCTIWLITDASIEAGSSENTPQRGHKLLLIAYQQFFHNTNPLITFKERKPGWFSSTTLPHTLSSALVNLTRNGLRRSSPDERPIIFDPFCGTCTSLIDAFFHIPNAICVGIDREAICSSLLKDNISFFKLSKEELERVIECVERVIAKISEASYLAKLIDEPQRVRNLQVAQELSHETRFHLALDIILQALMPETVRRESIPAAISQVHSILSAGFPTVTTERMQNQLTDIITRVLFFSTWRAVVLGEFFIHKSGVDGLRSVLDGEFKALARELKDLAEDRAYFEKEKDETQTYSTRKGLYSENGSLSPDRFEDLERNLVFGSQLSQLFDKADPRRFRIMTGHSSIDALKELKNSVDVIVTDPPYGFNKDDGNERQMQSLYADFITYALTALKDNGQIILALPDFAKNGKQIAYYQTRNMLLRQIFTAAFDAGKEIVQYNRPRPQPESLVGPPYYWGTTGVLSRSTLHFFVRSR